MSTGDMELVQAARGFLRVPFKHRGRSRRGMDCAGLVVCSFLSLGRPVVDKRVYGREPHKDGLREVVRSNQLDLVSGEWLPGDVALMRFVQEPHHLGVFGDYLHGGLSLIHSYAEVGRVVEHRLDEVWAGRVLEVYRYRKE